MRCQGYEVEIPGESAEETKKIWTCSSCARSIRGRYRMKKLETNVDFSCAMAKGPTYFHTYSCIYLRSKVTQDTCYSAAYLSQTQEQQRFAISEVAADWHELMIPQRSMRPSIARANGQLDPRCS